MSQHDVLDATRMKLARKLAKLLNYTSYDEMLVRVRERLYTYFILLHKSKQEARKLTGEWIQEFKTRTYPEIEDLAATTILRTMSDQSMQEALRFFDSPAGKEYREFMCMWLSDDLAKEQAAIIQRYYAQLPRPERPVA